MRHTTMTSKRKNNAWGALSQYKGSCVSSHFSAFQVCPTLGACLEAEVPNRQEAR